MEQLTQQLKSGRMEILEVPVPDIGRNQVLVRNLFSVISPGTEGRTVSDARKGYIAKARSRRDEVKQVLDSVRTNGLLFTRRLVMAKLEAPSPLGYSCAGEVIAVGADVSGIKPGDRVACGGPGACHADFVAVERNLCARVPADVPLKRAAFSTLAAIALHGIRQSEVRIGETAAVIGLGLIGQLTLQILNAGGVRAVGIDIDDRRVEAARRSGASLALNRNAGGLERAVQDFSGGFGVDAAIVTAGSSSNDPLEIAGELCRKKGKVVVVGGVRLAFRREHYYRKELDLRLSCSYGPGRYDPLYEERGIDYPIGYVRWTENRNMQAFIGLLAAGKVDVDGIVTHSVKLENAPEAYGMILERSEHVLGVVIEYGDDDSRPRPGPGPSASVAPGRASGNIGLIGAGSFARNILLPAVRKAGTGILTGVADVRPLAAKDAAVKHHFRYSAGRVEDVLADKNIDTVFIATRHDSHAMLVLEALRAGKNVFVEKPLCLTVEELEAIRLKMEQRPARLMVGFNRRFAPHILALKETFRPERPKAIIIRINAGAVPGDHWVHDPAAGGGRIVGEGCHFVDLASLIAGAGISSVTAKALEGPGYLHDTVSLLFDFENGSVASIAYFANGPRDLPKERLEVYCDGQAAIIDDFRTLTIVGKKTSVRKLRTRDKGHETEIRLFLESVVKDGPPPIPWSEIHHSMAATFKVMESLRTGCTVRMVSD